MVLYNCQEGKKKSSGEYLVNQISVSQLKKVLDKLLKRWYNKSKK